MKYIIRELEEKDNKEIENIIRSCLIEFDGNREGLAWADPELGRLSTVYNKDGYKYWVIEEKETKKLVGGAGIGKIEALEDICELQKMYCLKEARGTGISHKLNKIELNYDKNK